MRVPHMNLHFFFLEVIGGVSEHIPGILQKFMAELPVKLNSVEILLADLP